MILLLINCSASDCKRLTALALCHQHRQLAIVMFIVTCKKITLPREIRLRRLWFKLTHSNQDSLASRF